MMTETMIDLPGVIAKTDGAEFLRDLIRDAAERLMDIEVSAVCGAGHGERRPERENQRNGYRSRQWDTRAGTVGLNIPKLRRGSYFPFGPSIDPPDRSMPSAPGTHSSSPAGRRTRR
jgi:transposase-like protein